MTLRKQPSSCCRTANYNDSLASTFWVLPNTIKEPRGHLGSTKVSSGFFCIKIYTDAASIETVAASLLARCWGHKKSAPATEAHSKSHTGPQRRGQEVVETILPRSRNSGSSSLVMASSAALVSMSACFTKNSDSLAYASERASLPL